MPKITSSDESTAPAIILIVILSIAALSSCRRQSAAPRAAQAMIFHLANTIGHDAEKAPAEGELSQPGCPARERAG
jgi:hypothetical protein